MVGVPSLFPPGREILTQYKWIDFVSASGYVLFDCTSFALTGGDEFQLVQSDIATTICTTETTQEGTCTTSWTKAVDNLDFDMTPLQLPRSLKGNVIVRVLQKITTTESTSGEVYFLIYLRKWNGTSETEIASAQSETLIFTALNGVSSDEKILTITAPLTHFKKGEQVRLTVEMWGKRTAGANFKLGLYHTPGTSASRCMAALPFRMDFM